VNDPKLWLVVLTSELDLETAKVNHHTKCLGLLQKSLSGHTETVHPHRTDCSTWTTKVVGSGHQVCEAICFKFTGSGPKEAATVTNKNAMNYGIHLILE